MGPLLIVPGWKDIIFVIGTSTALVALAFLPIRSRTERNYGPGRIVDVMQDKLTFDEVTDGYYEGLLGAAKETSSSPIARLMKEERPAAPEGWKKLQDTGAVDRSDPYLLFALKPNLDVISSDAPLRTNRWAQHDRDYTLAPPPGVRRIAFIGASILQGVGVAYDDTFEARFEDALGDGCEVINFGVSGYRFSQQLHVATEIAPRFEPDLVLLVLSDITVNPRWWLHLWHLVESGSPLQYEVFESIAGDTGIGPRTRQRDVVAAFDEVRERVLQETLRYMVAQVRASGARIAVVTVPQPGHAAELRKRVRVFEPVLEELEVPRIDLLDAFDGVTDPKTLWLRPYDRHPNVEGHRLLAEKLIDRFDPALLEQPGD